MPVGRHALIKRQRAPIKRQPAPIGHRAIVNRLLILKKLTPAQANAYLRKRYLTRAEQSKLNAMLAAPRPVIHARGLVKPPATKPVRISTAAARAKTAVPVGANKPEPVTQADVDYANRLVRRIQYVIALSISPVWRIGGKIAAQAAAQVRASGLPVIPTLEAARDWAHNAVASAPLQSRIKAQLQPAVTEMVNAAQGVKVAAHKKMVQDRLKVVAAFALAPVVVPAITAAVSQSGAAAAVKAAAVEKARQKLAEQAKQKAAEELKRKAQEELDRLKQRAREKAKQLVAEKLLPKPAPAAPVVAARAPAPAPVKPPLKPSAKAIGLTVAAALPFLLI